MSGENDLGSGSNFDMEGALAQMSEGLGFEAGSSNEGDGSGLEGGNGSEGGSLELDPNISEADLQNAEKLAEVSETKTTEVAPATGELPGAPKTWRKEAAELWTQLPAQVQAEIQKREDDMFRGLETYKTDANFGRSLRGALDPYMPVLQQYGIDPARQVSSLMNAHYTLALGTPQEKQALFQRLAQDYDIDLQSVADPAGAPFVDPAVQALQSELRSVQSTLQAQTRATEQAKISDLTKQIETFAADPKNQYFDEVANDMVTLLQTGVVKTLEEAYDKAVWTNPATRAKVIEQQTAERIAKQREAAAKHAAKAKQASSVAIRPQARQASGTAPTGSMDDTLRETLAEITSRTR